MDYLNYILTTFLGFERGSCFAVYTEYESSQDFIKYILICVPKMNKGLEGLGRYEGEYLLMTKLKTICELSL